MAKREMLEINMDEVEKRARDAQMTLPQLSDVMRASLGYLWHVKSNGGQISKLKYEQLITVLNVPFGTFIPKSKAKTLGELLSSGEITPEDFKQQHPSISEQEPEQIELISIEHEMLLEVKKLTSTMQEILNVLKGWE